jgi:hypothetical protein
VESNLRQLRPLAHFNLVLASTPISAIAAMMLDAWLVWTRLYPDPLRFDPDRFLGGTNSGHKSNRDSAR